MMGDARALQSATSHNLGQNFAKAFDIQYLDAENTIQHCWTTSWGLSTRFIGAIIMVHGDDTGLILPPRLAPYQVVIVPIYRSAEERSLVFAEADRVAADLGDYRVRIDKRDGVTPGFKFNDWEMRGVPLRIELGPRDIAQGSVMLARRDRPGKAGKTSTPRAGLSVAVGETLADIHTALYERALRFRNEHTVAPSSYAEFGEAVEQGFALAPWCEQADCEAAIKDDTRATSRCIPLEQDPGRYTCIRDGRPASRKAIFGRAY
jgi:prolyl-tRNA synthetase